MTSTLESHPLRPASDLRRPGGPGRRHRLRLRRPRHGDRASRSRGRDDFVVLERGDDVGGTWRDNTYPAPPATCRRTCTRSRFAPNPDWPRTYSAPARDPGLPAGDAPTSSASAPHCRFGADVLGAAGTRPPPLAGRRRRPATFRARRARLGGRRAGRPDAIPTSRAWTRSRARRIHSARWDHAHDLAGERVAVIGTGASAIQIVPAIQPAGRAASTVYQRTPPWVVPRTDHPVTPVDAAASTASSRACRSSCGPRST